MAKKYIMDQVESKELSEIQCDICQYCLKKLIMYDD